MFAFTKYIPNKTDFDSVRFSVSYAGGKYKVLVVATDEHYLITKNGKMFSTGNHPVETLLHALHIHEAGFEIEVATLSGNPAKFETWAMPKDDKAVNDFYHTLLPQLKQPKKLSDSVDEVTTENSPYLGVFLPSGYGALNGLPHSQELKIVLEWSMAKQRLVITLCDGTAGLLVAAENMSEQDFVFKDYEMCVFPDTLDEGANVDIGYIPGHLPWSLGKSLEKLGVKIVSHKDTIDGKTHQNRNVLTGDRPLVANALGIMSADALLKRV